MVQQQKGWARHEYEQLEWGLGLHQVSPTTASASRFPGALSSSYMTQGTSSPPQLYINVCLSLPLCVCAIYKYLEPCHSENDGPSSPGSPESTFFPQVAPFSG